MLPGIAPVARIARNFQTNLSHCSRAVYSQTASQVSVVSPELRNQNGGSLDHSSWNIPKTKVTKKRKNPFFIPPWQKEAGLESVMSLMSAQSVHSKRAANYNRAECPTPSPRLISHKAEDVFSIPPGPYLRKR